MTNGNNHGGHVPIITVFILESMSVSGTTDETTGFEGEGVIFHSFKGA